MKKMSIEHVANVLWVRASYVGFSDACQELRQANDEGGIMVHYVDGGKLRCKSVRLSNEELVDAIALAKTMH
jgi:hypothetical protein